MHVWNIASYWGDLSVFMILLIRTSIYPYLLVGIHPYWVYTWCACVSYNGRYLGSCVCIVRSTRAIVHGKHLSRQICTRHLVIIFGDVVFVFVRVRVRGGGGGTFGEWSESLPTSPIQLTPLPLDSKRHVEQFKGHILWLACDYSPKSALCILSSTYCVLLIDGSHAYIHTYIRVVYILMHVIGDQDKCSASWEYPV